MKKVIATFLTLLTISLAYSNDGIKSKKIENNATLQVRLTDLDQSSYGLVIEIINVEIYNEKLGWVVLNEFQQTISSYSFSKGNESLLANELIPAGKYSKLRITFGTSNSIYRIDNVNGHSKKLDFETNDARQVEVSIDENFVQNEESELLVDFNVSNSILNIGNQYLLNPDLEVVNNPSKVTLSTASKLIGILSSE